MSDDDVYLSPKESCALIGGPGKPISIATLYRGIKAGRYPPFDHPSPGISRHRKSKLVAALEALNKPEAA